MSATQKNVDKLIALYSIVSSARNKLLNTVFTVCSSKKFLKRIKKYESRGAKVVTNTKDGSEVVVVSRMANLGKLQQDVFNLARIIAAEQNKKQ
jgi:hypothetical protein